MKIVFLGSGAFGLPTLRRLAVEHEVLAVVSQPDRPAGRGSRLTPTPIAAWTEAELSGVPLLREQRVSDAEPAERVRGLEADAWVVIAFGQKLSAGLLEGRFACNLHASLLPRWRGAAPINAAVVAGDPETGNSVITLADRMDAGLVLGRSTRAIEPGQTAGELHDLLAEDGPELVLEVLRRHQAGTLEPLEQDESLVTVAPKLTKADGAYDPAWPAAELANRINGLNPWPTVTAGFRGEPLKLLRAVSESTSAERRVEAGDRGRVTDPAAGLVACSAGSVRLLEVQPAGKRPMAWDDFCRGRGVTTEERLEPH